MSSVKPACLWILAGTNGAGKSSVGGAMLRASGGDYFNPDEVSRELMERDPSLDVRQANGLAWRIGVRQLDRATAEGKDYFMETTLGGDTIAERLAQALARGFEVRVWYVGLATVEEHLVRVAKRVRRGGHDIPEEAIRKRFDSSRRNLLALLAGLTELKMYDNTPTADPAAGKSPSPRLVLHWRSGRVVGPRSLRRTPEWAKPIVAQAIKHDRHRER